MIADRPWTGFGFDAFEPAFMLYHRPPLPSDVTWNDAHSTYLENWSELGLIAGSIPILVLLLVAWSLARLVRHRKDDYALSMAALSVLLLAAIHSLVDFSFEVPANVYLLIVILALGLGRAGARAGVA